MIALITGASSGIGREFAKQLENAPGIDGFWLVARRREAMEELSATLKHPCRIISADLTTDEGLKRVEDLLAEEKPQIKYFINAAGYGKFGNTYELSRADVTGMIDLNVRAVAVLSHAVLPYMPKGSHLIQLGSGSCFTPLPNFAIYAASKSFVLHYSKALYAEAKPYGVSVTCFCPGWVDTGFIEKAEDPSVSGPKASAFHPLLKTDKVVKKALRDAKKGKRMSVTNWYTKLQHFLFKAIPDCLLTAAWLKMQKPTPEKEEKKD